MKHLILIFSILTLLSCGSSSKTVKKTRRPPSTTKVDPAPSQTDKRKPDVVKIKEIDPVKKPPIEIDGNTAVDNKVMKSEYNVALVLPLNANNYVQKEGAADEQFVQYYAGVKMALEEINQSGIKLNVDIIDCSASSNLKDALKKGLKDDTDIVIGPYSKSDLDDVVEYCQKNDISVVSPWRSSSSITVKNPYYIQMRPNIRERYFKIMTDIASQYDPTEVVIVARNNAREKRVLKYFSEISKFAFDSKNDTIVNEFFINEDSLALGVFAYEDLIKKGKKVFVFHNYSYDDENYLYSCMRRLSAEKGVNQVFVYGMPILKDSDKINYDYYSALNMNIVVSEFIDNDNQEVIDFKRRFYNKYGAIAIGDALEGYDLMGFIAMALDRYGKNFQNHIDDKTYNGIQTKVQLQKKYNDDEVGEDFEDFDFYENKYLEIISFKNGKFKAKS
jgi:ABC-type branched-subunit amino acid transport system substrate-binding protein